MTTQFLLAALLSVLRPPAGVRERIDARREAIAEQAAASAERHGVPPALLLVVAYAETHLGVDHGEGGNWGAPVSRTQRHTAGTSDHAAQALAASYRVCGSWARALRRFRSGLCHRDAPRGYTAARALHLVERVHERAGVPLPEGLH